MENDYIKITFSFSFFIQIETSFIVHNISNLTK